MPLLISPRLSKKVLEKSKFFKAKSTSFSTPTQSSYLYVQASKINIKDIVRIKENFLSLSAKKVEEVYKILNDTKKNKPKFNMITKDIIIQRL